MSTSEATKLTETPNTQEDIGKRKKTCAMRMSYLIAVSLLDIQKSSCKKLNSALKDDTLLAGALRCLIYWYNAENVQSKLFPKKETDFADNRN